MDSVGKDVFQTPGFAKSSDCQIYAYGCNGERRSIRCRGSIIKFRVNDLGGIRELVAEPQSTAVFSNVSIGNEEIAF